MPCVESFTYFLMGMWLEIGRDVLGIGWTWDGNLVGMGWEYGGNMVGTWPAGGNGQGVRMSSNGWIASGMRLEFKTLCHPYDICLGIEDFLYSAHWPRLA